MEAAKVWFTGLYSTPPLALGNFAFAVFVVAFATLGSLVYAMVSFHKEWRGTDALHDRFEALGVTMSVALAAFVVFITSRAWIMAWELYDVKKGTVTHDYRTPPPVDKNQ